MSGFVNWYHGSDAAVGYACRDMSNPKISGASQNLRRLRAAGGVLLLALSLVACGDRPRPRTFADFTEDRVAREGTLARCNANRETTLDDIECANARRAQSAIALSRERERREQLERESERRIAALTAQIAERERLAQEQVQAAEKAAKEAYEAMWNEQQGDTESAEAAPAVDSIADGPIANGPIANGEIANGEIADRPITDGPSPDAAPGSLTLAE
jgi:hypothetical protein